MSIVNATCDTARALHLGRVGIFGTRFTMEGRFYSDVFSTAGIDLVAPRDDERAYIHEKYMGELVRGRVSACHEIVPVKAPNRPFRTNRSQIA